MALHVLKSFRTIVGRSETHASRLAHLRPACAAASQGCSRSPPHVRGSRASLMLPRHERRVHTLAQQEFYQGGASQQEDNWGEAPTELNIGVVVSGVVQGITPFGAFIELPDYGTTGLLHITQISAEYVQSVDQVLQVGEEIKVLVTKMDRQRGRVGLSTKELEPSPGDMVRNRQLVFDKAEETAEGLPKDAFRDRAPRDAGMQNPSVQEGGLVLGTVQSIAPFGAFIELPGGDRGLLHISQISDERVESVDQVLQVGEEIKVLVVEVDRERGRIALSTKRLEPNPGDMVHNRQLVFEMAEEMASNFVPRRERRDDYRRQGQDRRGQDRRGQDSRGQDSRGQDRRGRRDRY